jgi:hypothetical protein
MTRVDHIAVRFVDFIPAQLDDGVLYVSRKYNTAVHRCCCGCGNRVTTPLTSTGWKLTVDADAPTLSPSIGNGAFPCRSHYWVRNGTIRWLSKITPEQTAHDRARDQKAVADAVRPPSLVERFTRGVRRLFRR